MAAIIFLMNTLTGCALKNENMEAIYKEFLDNGDVGSLQWSWVLEPGQYEDIRFVNDNMVAVQNGSDREHSMCVCIEWTMIHEGSFFIRPIRH